MNRFSNEEVESYYDQTEVHYRSAWDLDESLALHYGYWEDDIKTFRASLERMNKKLAMYGEIKSSDKVLDAGCGVGGSAIYLASTLGCEVDGVTLSAKQVERAIENAIKSGVQDKLNFQVADFNQLPYDDNTFDVLWALESAVYSPDKSIFLAEAYRVLKPGGRIIFGEYIKPSRRMSDKENQVFLKWLHSWALEDLTTLEDFEDASKQTGFSSFSSTKITDQIRRSAWRMYYGSFYMTFLSGLYKMYNPKVSPFANSHHEGLRNQYRSLKKGLWDYYFVKCIK